MNGAIFWELKRCSETLLSKMGALLMKNKQSGHLLLDLLKAEIKKALIRVEKIARRSEARLIVQTKDPQKAVI